jgi:hypothetical protein
MLCNRCYDVAAAMQIKTDLIIARSANEGDMRYNLDLSHAEDLPINSLGRRVRTRLYFTSEVQLAQKYTLRIVHSSMLRACSLLM